MKVHYVKTMIERDVTETLPICVLATEIPILQMIYKGKMAELRVQDEFQEIDTGEEYDRLELSYGLREGKRSFAEEVYGSAQELHRRMSAYPPPPETLHNGPEAADPGASAESGLGAEIPIFGDEPVKASRRRGY